MKTVSNNKAGFSSNMLIKYLLIGAGLLAVYVLPDAFFSDPQYSVCIHYNLLGFQCPLCGMTRAVHEFSGFHLRDALAYNFNIIFLPLYIIFDILALSTGKAMFFTFRKWSLVLLFAGLVFLYLVRIIHHFGMH